MVLNTRLDLIEARSLYARHGYTEIPAYCTGPYKEIWYGKELTPEMCRSVLRGRARVRLACR